VDHRFAEEDARADTEGEVEPTKRLLGDGLEEILASGE